jgi:hypothetical protein
MSVLLACIPYALEVAYRGVHCDNITKQRAGKYMVIYIHKTKILEFS